MEKELYCNLTVVGALKKVNSNVFYLLFFWCLHLVFVKYRKHYLGIYWIIKKNQFSEKLFFIICSKCFLQAEYSNHRYNYWGTLLIMKGFFYLMFSVVKLKDWILMTFFIYHICNEIHHHYLIRKKKKKNLPLLLVRYLYYDLKE